MRIQPPPAPYSDPWKGYGLRKARYTAAASAAFTVRSRVCKQIDKNRFLFPYMQGNAL